MTLSRIHIGMLAVVSIFTGVIAPAVHDMSSTYPFPLTSMQIPAYIILFSIGCIFLLVSMSSWSWVRLLGTLTLLTIAYLFVASWSGEVVSLKGQKLTGLSWGWVFLLAGSALLLVSMFGREEKDEKAHIFDRIIGMVGIMTILFLTILIIGISLPRNAKEQLLVDMFGTGNIITRSGIVLSPAFSTIEKLSLDRANDRITFFTASGAKIALMPDGDILDEIPYAMPKIGSVQYRVTSSGQVYRMGETQSLGKAYIPQDMSKSILMQSESGTLTNIGESSIRTISGSHLSIEDIVSSKDGRIHAWKTASASGQSISLDGVIQGEPQYEILRLSLSQNGKSVMAVIKESDGTLVLMKNGVKTERLPSGYVRGSIRMNGNDSIYAVANSGTIQLVYNGSILDRSLEEVREIFLDDSGSDYSYFGRPIGEKTYCFYTRYKGNLCGLSGYMNPRKSADGSSIIYAGLKDGKWGIYRNLIPIIENTGYPNQQDISRDYVFYDSTEPRYYLFISHTPDGYRLYKQGRYIEGVWEDVGLDVSFGYDRKVIMSVKDANGWHIAEF